MKFFKFNEIIILPLLFVIFLFLKMIMHINYIFHLRMESMLLLTSMMFLLFVEVVDHGDDLYMRTYPLHERGFNGASFEKVYIRPLTRFMARKIKQEKASNKKTLIF